MRNEIKCIICKSQKLHQVTKLDCAIASDCQPVNANSSIYKCLCCGHYQKKQNAAYHDHINTIYSNYSAYSLNDGLEQLSFSGDIPFTRCEEILHNCEEVLDNKNTVEHLDIGTGSGAMLQAIESKELNWEKSAQDVNDSYSQLLIDKHHLTSFYSNTLEVIEKKFDVITVIHVLEHILDPRKFLIELNNIMKPDGVAIIQVPNINENFWDFAIFDHVSHFSKSTLLKLLSITFTSVNFPKKQVPKELTVIVSNQLSNPVNNVVKDNLEPHFLFNERVKRIKSLSSALVLGTGPAANFCALLLKGNYLGSLDEDPRKIGKKLFNKVILDATGKYDDKVFLPYPEKQINKIQERLPHHRYEV